MADNGIGSSLVISEDVFKNIDRAEESVKNLEKTTEKAATNITASFRAMADGVNPFIEQISKARKLVEGLDLSNTGASKAYSDIDNLSNSLAKTKDEAEKAANAMVIVGKEVERVNKLKEARETTLIDRKLQESYDKQIQRELDVLKLREKQEYKEVERQVLLERQKHEATQKEINDSSLVDRILSEQQQRKINREIEIAKLREQQQKAEVENLLFLEKKREETAKKEKQMFLGTYTGSMNMEENSINQRIAKIKQLQIARDSLSKTDADYKVRLDALNDSIKRLNRENAVAISGSKDLQEQHGRLLNTSDQLMRKLALVFSVSQISGYVTKMVEVRGEFELQNKALAAILQNKEQADQLFDKITKLAVQSPFQLKELVTYTKQLAAYRVETEKLFDTTKMLADISAGLGVDMNRLILAYGQVKAANYLRGTELRQFSEAGINILGELSSYFTELEGNIVSVGDVFERVSKRMVKFSDVEVIFKKMTSEGGIFYKMQEQQAETIAGQLSNLRDSIAVTMDEIGKANEGSIKGVLSSIRTLASNWETVANVINAAAIGFALYTAKTLLAASANKAFTASAIESTIASGGLTSALAKTKIMMADLGKFAKSNIFLIIASGVAMLGMELWDHIKSVDALKEKYDTLSISLGKQKSEITNIIKSLKEQSDILESSSKNMSSLSKETEDYTKEQSRNNEAQKKQNALLQDLKTKHPEIYAGLSKQKDGTIDLTKAQDELNSQLERTNYLNFLAKQTEGYFSKGLIQNLETINQQQIDFNKATNDANNAWVQLSGKVGAIMDSSKDVSQETKKAFLDIAESGLSSGEKLGKTLVLLSNDTSKLRSQFIDLANASRSSYSNMIKASDDLNKTQSELIKTISSISQDFKRSYDSSTKEGEKAAQNTLKVFLESLNIQEQAVIDFVTKRFEVEIGIKLPETTLVKEYSGMQKRIKEYVEKKGFSIDLIQADQSETEYFEKLTADLRDTEENIKQLENATEQLNDKITNEEAIKQQRKIRDEQMQTLKDFGRYSEIQKKDTNIFKSRIDLIKKVNSEYDKLLKNYDKETAKLKVQEAYKDAFKEVGMGEVLFSMDFDKMGVVKQLEKLSKEAGSASKREFEKAIADFKVELGVDVQIEGRDRLSKEIESMFGGYELSIELDKLEVPQSISQEIAKQFGFEYITLDKLEEEILKLKNTATSLGSETVKVYDDALAKISNIQAKRAKEGVDEYIKYLKRSVSERVQIELDAQKKISNIPSQFSESQRTAIEGNILKEKQKALDKLAWDDFKGGDLYIRLFEDLEFASTKSLEKMREKLSAIKESLKELSPEQLKEVTRQMQQIDEILMARDPFSKMIPNIKEYIGYLKERTDIERKWEASSTREAQIKGQVEDQELLVANLRQQLASEEQIYGVGSNQANQTADKLAIEESILDTVLKQLVAQGKITQEYSDALRKGDALSKGLAEAFGKTGNYLNDFSAGITDMSDSLQSIFGTFTDGMNDSIDSVSEIAAGLGGLATGAGRLVATGGTDIGAWIQSIGSLASIIGSVFAIGDKKKERQIKREIEYVEKLEKAYRKLESAINDAYSIDTLKNATDDAIKNIQAQIKSYQAMIKAEDDKKKTDKNKIKDWENKIEELREMEQKLQEDLIANLGGFGSESAFKDAATSFVDAWANAFKETGDGLSGLQDQFDEWINNAVRQQILLKLSNQYIKPILESMDKMFAEGSVGGADITKEELDALKELMDKNAIAFDEAAKKYLEQLGLLGDFGGGAGELSGLQKGIQSITEETASALEALLNSMRFFVSDSNLQLRNLYAIFSDTSGALNPMLLELKAQTLILKSIDSQLKSVIKAGFHSGGSGVKVIM